MKNVKQTVQCFNLFIWAFCANSIAASAWHDTGEVFLYNKQYKEAADYYYRLTTEEPTSVHVHRNYQDACFAGNDSMRKEVLALYRRMYQEDSTNALFCYLYGRCLPCDEGMEYFDAAIRHVPCDTWALNARGACYFEDGDLHNAKEAFLKAIKCEPDFGEAYQNLSQVYLQKKQQRRAKKVFRKLIARDRSRAQSYEWLGDMYLNQESYQYARMGYQKAVKLGRTGPAIFFKLGYTHFREKKFLYAKESYLQSIACGNATYEVYYNLGATYEQIDMPEEALESYQRSFDLHADHAVLYSMGSCAVQLGLYTKAIESYNAFLKYEPKNTEALTGLANAYQLKKEYDNAIAIYKKIISIDDTNAKAYYNLGSIYAYYLKEYENMERYWGKYIDLFPDEKDSRFIQKEMEKITNH